MKELLKNKKRWVVKVLLSLLAALYCMSSASLPAWAREYTETDFTKNNPQIIADCEKLIKDAMDKGNISGLSVAVVDEKDILWSEGFGYTDKNKKTKVTPDTIFSVQSISKTITATAVMKVVQDGVLDLDKSINYYLPDFTVNSAFEKEPESKITLRHLLSHTAGFAHEATVGSNYDPYSPSFEEHIKSISSTWLKFPVGENYSYSNLGVDLAGYILQKQSGKPFYQYVDENIVKPLGMTNSTFNMDQIKANKNRAVAQSRMYWKIPLEIPIIPSGGFYSSASDMAKFIQFHINNGMAQNRSIIDSSYLNEMYKIPFPLEGQTEGYALGIGKGKSYNTYLLNHNGGGFCFLSSMTWYPELKIGVIVLSNTFTISTHAPQPANISGEILKRIIEDPKTIYYSRLNAIEPGSFTGTSVTYNALEKALVTNVTNRLSAIKSSGIPKATDYKKYTGTYCYFMYGMPFVSGTLEVTEKNGNLSANGDMLTEVSDGVFYMNSGEVLDFNGSTPTFRNIELKKLPFGLTGSAVLAGICILVFITFPFLGVFRRNKNTDKYKVRTQRLYKIIQGLSILLYISYIIFILYLVSLYGKGLASGALIESAYVKLGFFISILKYISLLVVILLPIVVILNILIWRNGLYSPAGRIHYSISTLFSIVFILLLYNINLILI